MPRLVPVLLILLLPHCPSAWAQVVLELSPGPGSQYPPGPYRPVVVKASAQGSSRLESVQLRWDEGGPTYIIDLLAAPGTSQSARILLPAARARQRYNVQLEGRNIPDPHREVELVWGARVALEPFPDPKVYDPFQQDLPRWPISLRHHLLWLSGLAILAGAGICLVKTPWRRLILAAVLTAGVSTGLWLLLRPVPSLTHRVFPTRVGAEEVPLHVLTARRPGTWTFQSDNYLPRYRNFGQILRDRSVIHAGRYTQVPLEPETLRIFQQVGP